MQGARERRAVFRYECRLRSKLARVFDLPLLAGLRPRDLNTSGLLLVGRPSTPTGHPIAGIHGFEAELALGNRGRPTGRAGAHQRHRQRASHAAASESTQHSGGCCIGRSTHSELPGGAGAPAHSLHDLEPPLQDDPDDTTPAERVRSPDEPGVGQTGSVPASVVDAACRRECEPQSEPEGGANRGRAATASKHAAGANILVHRRYRDCVDRISVCEYANPRDEAARITPNSLCRRTLECVW